VVARIDETPCSRPDADVAIEFSTPETALKNIETLAAMKIPVVAGTTGWFADLDRARKTVDREGTALVYGANFSIGVARFTAIVEEAARRMAGDGDYEAWAWEMHHSAKTDAPSGTALALLAAMRRAGYNAKIDVSSSRAGRVPGTHEIGFDSASDTITLRHTARSREGFARGALHAARWVIGKRGVHEFQEILR
jgi:4-hydroxy-tetrahydrodipicolinate reductase